MLLIIHFDIRSGSDTVNEGRYSLGWGGGGKVEKLLLSCWDVGLPLEAPGDYWPRTPGLHFYFPINCLPDKYLLASPDSCIGESFRKCSAILMGGGEYHS